MRNRAMWDDWARNFAAEGELAWARETPEWGIWHVPEEDGGLLPEDPTGKRAIELGCGTGYVSAWLARLGAHPIGIDNSWAQLTTARRLQHEHKLDFPLIHGNAEYLPFPDSGFDFAISEYGASLWADPQLWLAEASRVLRPGGQLAFLTNSFLMSLCMTAQDNPVTNQLMQPAFGMYRVEWPDDPGVEFHLSHGDWIRLLRRFGFEIEDLIELRPREGATTRYPYVTLEWARQWPCEEIWKARKMR